MPVFSISCKGRDLHTMLMLVDLYQSELERFKKGESSFKSLMSVTGLVENVRDFYGAKFSLPVGFIL